MGKESKYESVGTKDKNRILGRKLMYSEERKGRKHNRRV
jgi:hypothetical protein